MATIRLQKIDETTRGDHIHLDDSDLVYYWREYTARQGYSYSETNQLIKNFKITPAEIEANLNRRHFKKQALNRLAAEVGSLIVPTVIRDGLTIVPIPPSKLPGQPGFDNRVQDLLTVACAGKAVDVRPLIRHTENADADHEGTRLRHSERLAITELDMVFADPIPRGILIFDDMVTNGTHFKVAKQLLAKAFPGVGIAGVFISRRIQPSIADAFGIVEEE